MDWAVVAVAYKMDSRDEVAQTTSVGVGTVTGTAVAGVTGVVSYR